MPIRDRALLLGLKLLPKNHVSRVAGRIAALELPPSLARAQIRAFARAFDVNFDEVRDPLESFTSVQSFFTRALREGAARRTPAEIVAATRAVLDAAPLQVDYVVLADPATFEEVGEDHVGEAVLAGHRLLLDQGVLQEGDEALAGTRHAAFARVSPATADGSGLADGEPVTVTGPVGTVTLPLRVTREMPDHVVWLPLNSVGGGVPSDLGALPGQVVRLARGAADMAERKIRRNAVEAVGCGGRDGGLVARSERIDQAADVIVGGVEPFGADLLDEGGEFLRVARIPARRRQRRGRRSLDRSGLSGRCGLGCNRRRRLLRRSIADGKRSQRSEHCDRPQTRAHQCNFHFDTTPWQ